MDEYLTRKNIRDAVQRTIDLWSRDCKGNHEFIDRVVIISPGFPIEEAEEMCKGMSPKVCKKCGWPGS